MYAYNQEGTRYRKEAKCWCDAYGNLRAQEPRVTDGGIVGESRLHTEEVDRLRADVTLSRAQLDNPRSKLANGGTVELRRDRNLAQQALKTAVREAVERYLEAWRPR